MKFKFKEYRTPYFVLLGYLGVPALIMFGLTVAHIHHVHQLEKFNEQQNDQRLKEPDKYEQSRREYQEQERNRSKEVKPEERVCRWGEGRMAYRSLLFIYTCNHGPGGYVVSDVDQTMWTGYSGSRNWSQDFMKLADAKAFVEK